MKSIVDGMVVEGKTVRNALVAVFALVVGAAMPSFAAERTVFGAYTLTANEDWTGDSVTLERGATVDLAGHNLAVGVVALGSGSVPCIARAARRRSRRRPTQLRVRRPPPR